MEEITEIGIHTAALRRDTDTLNQTLREIRSEMDGLYEAFRILNTMWDGPANETFNRQFCVDHENMDEICGTIQLLVNCMERAGDRYERGGSQVRAIVDAIRI